MTPPTPSPELIPTGPTPVPRNGTVLMVTASLIGGLAIPVLYVAWLNRGGPGEVCSVDATSTHCTEEWNPWPILAVAAFLILVAVLLARTGIRNRRTARAAGHRVESLWIILGWALVGALGCLSILGMLTIGPMVLPVAALLAAVLLGRRQPLAAGLLALWGAAPLALLAFVQREGPVDGCQRIADGGEVCRSVPNPWPWAIGALVFVAIGGWYLSSAWRQARRDRPPAV